MVTAGPATATLRVRAMIDSEADTARRATERGVELHSPTDLSSKLHDGRRPRLDCRELRPRVRRRAASTDAPATTGRKDRPLRVVPEPSSWVAPDSHRPHGSYAKYTVELCRCEPCRRAKRDYERARQHAIRRPDQVWAPYVPAGAARRHVRELAAAGVGLKQLAKVSGLPHGLLSKLVYGDRARGMASSRRIRRETHEAIMAVRPSDFAGGTRLDAGPTWALLERAPRGRLHAHLDRLAVGGPVDAGSAAQPALSLRPQRPGSRRALCRVPLAPGAAQEDEMDEVSSLIPELSLAEVPAPGSWCRSARCRGVSPAVFFVTHGSSVDQARAICSRCPVAADCLEYALAWPQLLGVWAATTVEQTRGFSSAPNCSAAGATSEERRRRARSTGSSRS